VAYLVLPLALLIDVLVTLPSPRTCRRERPWRLAVGALFLVPIIFMLGLPGYGVGATRITAILRNLFAPFIPVAEGIGIQKPHSVCVFALTLLRDERATAGQGMAILAFPAADPDCVSSATDQVLVHALAQSRRRQVAA